MVTEGWTRIRVLVIDDSDAARAAINEVLAPAGYEVMQLPSAIGATRTILRNAVDAVIIDISMPGLSGDRLVELLRSNPRCSELVIIVVSGDADQLQRISEELSVDGIVPKSHIGSRLEMTLARALSSAKRRTQPEIPRPNDAQRAGAPVSRAKPATAPQLAKKISGGTPTRGDR
jgi:CheY-like chemotaxis protein